LSVDKVIAINTVCSFLAHPVVMGLLCPHLNLPMFQRVDICYVCLVHFLLHDSPDRISQQD